MKYIEYKVLQEWTQKSTTIIFYPESLIAESAVCGQHADEQIYIFNTSQLSGFLNNRLTNQTPDICICWDIPEELAKLDESAWKSLADINIMEWCHRLLLII